MIRHLYTAVANLLLFIPRALRWLFAKLRRVEVIQYDFEGEVVWRASRRRWWARRRTGVALDDLDSEWEAVAANARIEAVVVCLREVKGGLVAAEALHARILKLRKRKRVVAFAPQLSNRNFAIVSAASTIVVSTAGGVWLTGLAVEAMHMRALLDKASMRVDVDAAGKYKGALERFTRDDLSEPQREVLDALLDSWFGDWVALIAAARGRSVDEVRAWVDHGPYTAEAARDAGLIDAVAYEDEIPKLIDAAHPPKVTKRSKMRSPKPPAVWPVRASSRRIAAISLKGLIHMDRSRSFPSPSTGERTICEQLTRAREDRRVCAVVLAIDSRGGSALASDLIWNEAMRVRREKPIVAWMGDYAASGGYYAACACNEIVASPFTITGSIGVIAGRVVLAELFRRLGVTRTQVGRGRFVGLDALGQPLDEESRAVVRGEVADCYAKFLACVGKARAMPLERVAELAEGRVYTGRDALGLGLVDALGDFSAAVERARALGGAPRAEVVPLVEGGGLFARSDRAAVESHSLHRFVRDALDYVRVVDTTGVAEIVDELMMLGAAVGPLALAPIRTRVA